MNQSSPIDVAFGGFGAYWSDGVTMVRFRRRRIPSSSWVESTLYAIMNAEGAVRLVKLYKIIGGVKACLGVKRTVSI
jgi:hypothetical protein